jgi:cobalt-zinc-cadmium efflux system outer membrane protein
MPSSARRGWLLLGILPATGCYHYRPQPILPPALEQQYRSRSLADSGLKEFVEAQPPEQGIEKPSSWPPAELNPDTLTLVAFYFHPDLDAARARLATTVGGVVTASTRPNPSISAAAGYTDADGLPYALGFSLDWPIETAGKRTYRTQQAQNLTEAARLSLGETAWQVRSRVRAALLDHLLASRDLQALQGEERTRSEAVAVFEGRLIAGDVSRPDVDIARTSLMLLQLNIERAAGAVKETRVALEGALGLAPGALEGIRLTWKSLEIPPTAENLSLQNVQRAGLLNRLDVQRLLVEYAARERALQLEAAKQYPDVHIAPGYSFGEGSINTYTIGPSLFLPLFDRNKGPIAEAEGRRKEAATLFLGQQAKAIDEMERALALYRSAVSEFRDADSKLKTLLNDREQAVQRQVDGGEGDRLSLVGVRLEAAAAARARLSALRAAQTALGALEDSVQRPLESGIPLPPVPLTNPRENASGGAN